MGLNFVDLFQTQKGMSWKRYEDANVLLTHGSKDADAFLTCGSEKADVSANPQMKMIGL